MTPEQLKILTRLSRMAMGQAAQNHQASDAIICWQAILAGETEEQHRGVTEMTGMPASAISAQQIFEAGDVVEHG